MGAGLRGVLYASGSLCTQADAAAVSSPDKDDPAVPARTHADAAPADKGPVAAAGRITVWIRADLDTISEGK